MHSIVVFFKALVEYDSVIYQGFMLIDSHEKHVVTLLIKFIRLKEVVTNLGLSEKDKSEYLESSSSFASG